METEISRTLPLIRKMTVEEAEPFLVFHGYRRGRLPSDYVCDAVFYKSFFDKTGNKKYFIEVKCYDGGRFDNPDYTGGLSIHQPCNEPFMHFDQHGFRDLTPESVALWEKRCELFYYAFGCEPISRIDD